MLIINSTGRLIESDFINKYLSIEWCPPDEILIELSLSPGTNYPPKRSPETTASYPARWLCVCVCDTLYIYGCVCFCAIVAGNVVFLMTAFIMRLIYFSD